MIHIFPTSVRLLLGVEVEHAGFTEVDLVGIPIESLQMVHTQVHKELKVALDMITLRLEDTQKILNDVTATWTAMEEIPDLLTIHKEVQKTQQELEAVATVMKDLLPLQRMLKMGKNKKLQGELQKLCAREEEYLKIVQPWQEEVSEIALQIDAKILEFKVGFI